MSQAQARESVVSLVTSEYLSDVRSRSIFRKINVTVMCIIVGKSGWQCSHTRSEIKGCMQRGWCRRH